MCNILVARALAGNADFREAMKYQKHAFEVYSEKVCSIFLFNTFLILKRALMLHVI